MKKIFLKKTVSAVVVAATITTLSPLGVSAQWRQNADSTWHYTEGNKITKGWKNISDVWYYFNSNGKMNTSWICDKGIWYYNDNSGAMQKDWVNVNGTWYYFDSTGAMKTGWIKDESKWYYADSTGAMQTGTINIDGKIYYFNKSGQLQTENNTSQTTLQNTLVDNNQGLDGQDSGKATENDDSTTSNTTVDVNVLPKLPQNYAINVQNAAENKILELMNQKRTEAGLKPLAMDNTLLQVARYKSNHMIQYNYFDHTTPEGNNWTSWLKVIGYEYTATGENIAYNNYDAVELFNQWWNSPGHRANMMNSSYNKVGVGVLNGNGEYMGTQTFSN